MRWYWRVLLACCAWMGTQAIAQPLSCGVVLMHGKWGTAQSPYLQPVMQKLTPLCQVKSLEMPWSRQRLYDRPYSDALGQIRQAVADLRQSGVQWVAVGGQSFGANATLAYMAQVGDVDALLPMAPGHVPERFIQAPEVRQGVEQARRAIEEGQGDLLVEMTDINQSQRRNVKAAAASLWSYFDPQGWGNMELSAQRIQRSVPVFWAIGTLDPLYPIGSEAVFKRLPVHPDSRYLVVSANHATTPGVASDELLVWVKARIGR